MVRNITVFAIVSTCFGQKVHIHLTTQASQASACRETETRAKGKILIRYTDLLCCALCTMECLTRRRPRFEPPWQKRNQPAPTEPPLASCGSSSRPKTTVAHTSLQHGTTAGTVARKRSPDLQKSFGNEPHKRPTLPTCCGNRDIWQRCPAPKRTCCRPPVPANKGLPEFSAFKVLYCKRSRRKHKTYW